MKYDLALDERRMLAIVRFHGPSSYQDHRDARDELAELAHTHGAHRILVDTSDSVFPDVSVVEQYAFAQSLASAFEPKTRIAVVVMQSSQLDFTFPETVAFNRGVLLKTFADKSQADAWLIDGSD